MQCIIFCGVQGSGKSTYYQQHFFTSHVRISLDLLRTRHRERRFLDLCLNTQMRFVVDNTNPSMAERSNYIAPALAARYEVVCYYFTTTLEAALLRNSLRSGKAQIPEKGLYTTYYKLVPPTFAEGYHRLFQVRIDSQNIFQVNEILPEQED